MIPAFHAQFATLPPALYSLQMPAPAPSPKLVALNEELARKLGFETAWLHSEEGINMLAGNFIPTGAKPLAQAYAGHQFGNWAGRLGDGRAILLGELKDEEGRFFDIHLKGAGPTPYSRQGDGYCALGPALREYIVSEALHALGIPTTRTLAVVTTGRTIFRERPLAGAIVVRVAQSHVRVGTFEYAKMQDDATLNALLDYAKARHYPQAQTARDLLRAVIRAQANLIAQWMGVGFVHGVMNTDNMTISGETIDFGPCAFLDEYHPLKVFSSIDQGGRYAFARQPDMALWNLAQFASALLPCLGEGEQEQRAVASEALDEFADIFNAAWLEVFAAKIGIFAPIESDRALIFEVLSHFASRGIDFTEGFKGLEAKDASAVPSDEWQRKRQIRRDEAGSGEEGKPERARANPQIIPRNHQIERAIRAAETGDFSHFHRLNGALKTPFDLAERDKEFAPPPRPEERVRQTFCGT